MRIRPKTACKEKRKRVNGTTRHSDSSHLGDDVEHTVDEHLHHEVRSEYARFGFHSSTDAHTSKVTEKFPKPSAKTHTTG